MRLIDITVNEVSLVDKAANKRKFAFMKRETSDVKDTKKEEIKEEVAAAAQIIKESNENKNSLTPEQLKEVTALNAEIIELVAQFKKQSK